MSLAETYVKSLGTAKTLAVIEAIKPSIKRNWSSFTVEERAAIDQAGKAAKERISGVVHTREEPAEMPYRADFERLTEAYQRCQTRDEVRNVRNEVEALARQGRLMIWQIRELFVSDIAALRRAFELDPPKVSPQTQRFLDALTGCDSFTGYDAILREALPYSLELERADSREWWVLEHAFELRSAELRQKTKQEKQQAKIPF